MEKIYDDPEFGQVTLRKRARSRRITLRVTQREGIVITLPWLVPFSRGLALLRERRDWIREALARIAAAPPPLSEEEIRRLRAEAKATLPPRLAELAARHGFVYQGVKIKNNRSNWGSCSRKGNINLNLRLALLPPRLRDYVLLHELCHLRHPDHGPAFHALLEQVCPGHRALARELATISARTNPVSESLAHQYAPPVSGT